jgi:dCMP deaminase
MKAVNALVSDQRQHKWDARLLSVASHVSTWSKDPSSKVGAIIAKDNKIIAQGYNGFPSEITSIVEHEVDRATKYQYVVHAETNALINAERSIRGCTLYVYGLPICNSCASIMIRAGIKRVVMPVFNLVHIKDEGHRELWKDIGINSQKMLEEAKVEVTFI